MLLNTKFNQLLQYLHNFYVFSYNIQKIIKCQFKYY
jgi:hypothetical protein